VVSGDRGKLETAALAFFADPFGDLIELAEVLV
jgi:hypothetical protein